MNLHWGHAQMWWLVLVPVGALALLVYGHQARRHLIERAGEHPLIIKLLASHSPERRLFKHLLLMLALVALTVTAFRPQHGRRPETMRPTGIDIAIAFDISKSMLARDVPPSRLDAAREELGRMMSALRGHRVALVPFAGIAFKQSPLTADRSAIRMYLKSLDPQQMPVGGTNLAMAITQSVELLTGGEDRGDRASRSRVVLLMTDGEDIASEANEDAKAAARKAAEAGVLIYAVGVGTRLGEPIPLLNADGTHAGYQQDSRGKPIYSKLNLTLLEELAQLADPEHPDAQRVFLYDGGDPVSQKLARAFDGLQKSAMESAIRHKYGEKYHWALIPVLLLLLLDLGVSERRPKPKEDVG